MLRENCSYCRPRKRVSACQRAITNIATAMQCRHREPAFAGVAIQSDKHLPGGSGSLRRLNRLLVMTRELGGGVGDRVLGKFWINPMRPWGEMGVKGVFAVNLLGLAGPILGSFRQMINSVKIHSSFSRILSLRFSQNFWAEAGFRAIRPPSHYVLGYFGDPAILPGPQWPMN